MSASTTFKVKLFSINKFKHWAVRKLDMLRCLLFTQKRNLVSISLMLEIPHYVHLIIVVFEDTCKNLLGVVASFDPVNQIFT